MAAGRGNGARQAGFALLEFVFAMAIFTVGFLALAGLVLQLNLQQREAERISIANNLATSLMEQLLADTDSLPAAGSSVMGSYGDIGAYPQFRTYYVVESTTAPAGMKRLRVGALWMRDGRRESTVSGADLTAASVATDRGTVELHCLFF